EARPTLRGERLDEEGFREGQAEASGVKEGREGHDDGRLHGGAGRCEQRDGAASTQAIRRAAPSARDARAATRRSRAEPVRQYLRTRASDVCDATRGLRRR